MTGRYQFLPWVRAGAAGTLTFTDPLAPVLARPDGRSMTALPVHLDVGVSRDEGSDIRRAVDVPLQMYGPGDVTGVDARGIIRTDPPARAADVEPNYLACIEFDRPDFPWFFTPAAAGGSGRLRPWLVLVVVAEASSGLRQATDGPLPVLTAPVGELPELLESWAWAHAQVVRTDDTAVGELLAAQPQRNLSRIMCPRRLQPQTAYRACLVPAFEAGRKAGLGLPVAAEDENRLAPAWTTGNAPAGAPVELPVYYSWRFATGTGGDFESLARLLTGRGLPADVGRRPIVVEDQPFGLPDVGRTPFEGALLAPGPRTAAQVDTAFARKLRPLLDLNRGVGRPVVGPPVYGSWQGAQHGVPGPGLPPRWLRELNLDPALRAAAGLGARVMQDRQEQLVAAAWQQLGDAAAVGHLERRADVAASVLGSLMRRRVAAMDAGRLVQFLGPAQARIAVPTTTLHSRLVDQGLTSAFSSASFRRALRPAGTLARRDSPMRLSLQRVAVRVATAVPTVGPPVGTVGFVTDANLLRPVLVLPILLSSAARRYKDAIEALQAYHASFALAAVTASRPTVTFSAAFKRELVADADPVRTVRRRLRARLSTRGAPPQGDRPDRVDALVQPSFPQPMYEALRELSPDLLLPGVGRIEADTVTLLESNPRFIEAFLVGLNHEMACELVWREFPGDVRHTYFRAFWDSSREAELLPPIRAFTPDAALGDSLLAGAEQLVLLVRGALLERYPDAVIYAVKAKTSGALGTEERLPIFRGRIDPDITFLGFDLGVDEARGGPGRPGWFLVVQEQPSAPRFGLDESRPPAALERWDDLAWSDMRTGPGGHIRVGDLTVPPAARPPGPVWARNGAHLAAILRQRPMRVAWHARRLLPADETPGGP